MRTDVLFSLFAWLLCSQLCSAGDTLNVEEKITTDLENLISAGKKFEPGFFSPVGMGSTSVPQTVVCVANRDKPVMDSRGGFQIAGDGNLVVIDTKGEIYWSSELEGSSSTNRTVKLMASGKLVLPDDDHLWRNYLWQSFQHPTGTFLPGMKIKTNLELTCWRNATDSYKEGR